MQILSTNPKFYQGFPGIVRIMFAVLSLILLGVILVLSLWQSSQAPINISHADKIAHGFAYFSLGFAALPAMGNLRPVFVWGGLTLCGIGVEIAQWAMQYGRQGDILDALANSTGALLAVGFWLLASSIIDKK